MAACELPQIDMPRRAEANSCIVVDLSEGIPCPRAENFSKKIDDRGNDANPSIPAVLATKFVVERVARLLPL
jgi:hypothetical protein